MFIYVSKYIMKRSAVQIPNTVGEVAIDLVSRHFKYLSAFSDWQYALLGQALSALGADSAH